MAESVVGPWARDKLDRLGKYLHAYTTIMRGQQWCKGYHYIDPFGMQVGWQTIAELAATNAIEIFLNFPVGMAIQRLLLRQPDKFTDVQRSRLDGYFGSSGWIDVLYRPRQTLFGDEVEDKIDNSGVALLKWYRRRLRGIFAHVSKAALIRNTRGGHLYYLLVASHNRTGIRIANDILSAGEVV